MCFPHSNSALDDIDGGYVTTVHGVIEETDDGSSLVAMESPSNTELGYSASHPPTTR